MFWFWLRNDFPKAFVGRFSAIFHSLSFWNRSISDLFSGENISVRFRKNVPARFRLNSTWGFECMTNYFNIDCVFSVVEACLNVLRWYGTLLQNCMSRACMEDHQVLLAKGVVSSLLLLGLSSSKLLASVFLANTVRYRYKLINVCNLPF